MHAVKVCNRAMNCVGAPCVCSVPLIQLQAPSLGIPIHKCLRKLQAIFFLVNDTEITGSVIQELVSKVMFSETLDVVQHSVPKLDSTVL
jgi:hypothetical protein